MPPAEPQVRAFFDEPTNTVSYLVWDAETMRGSVIDPVLDFDIASGEADVRSAEAILAAAKDEGVKLDWVLETHAHADHLSAAPFIKQQTGAKIGIGEHIKDVQKIFRPVFAADDLTPDGSDFDHLFKDGERFNIGSLEVEVLHVPGHTPADIAFKIGDRVWVGDTLFMPDFGTARADFPGGDARQLYRSIRKLLELPDHTTIYLCHDYKAPGRDEYRWETTIGEQRENSVHIRDGVSEDEFVAMREERDASLAVPRLLLPSIQVNIRAGRLPEAEDNGVQYLKIPIKPVRHRVGDES
ncbi:MAG: MBL fold metallo-hydrolase [Sphingomonadaceae bacterium]|nr:MAG: MBL fold metallo-hydrolase [Sphingomonadaceae bacterium]